METMNLPESKLVRHQTKRETVLRTVDGQKLQITAIVGWDDDCGNGQNSLSVTANVYEVLKNGRHREHSFGCCHELIAKYFPHLKDAIKYHLVNSTGPMGYVANTLYHASDKDCWGTRKGEVRSYKTVIKFGDFPITWGDGHSQARFIEWLRKLENYDLTISTHAYDGKNDYDFTPKYSFVGFGDSWYGCPFGEEQEAQQFLEALQAFPPQFIDEPHIFGEGKEPELEAARGAACWPDATLEQLQDKEALIKRLPALMKDVKRVVEALGFEY